jgi:DNA-binding beta-propeller fold protein YncE
MKQPRLQAWAALGSAAIMGMAVLVPAQPAAAFSFTVSEGPQSAQTAVLTTPTGLSASTPSCPSQPNATGVPLSWAGSTALDASGGYEVGYYGVFRSVDGGAFTATGGVSGSPPATAFTDDTAASPLPATTYFATEGDQLESTYHGAAASGWTVVGNYDFGPEENLIAATPDGTAVLVAESGAPGGQVLVFGARFGAPGYDQLLSTVTLPGAAPQPIAIAMAPNGSAAYVLDESTGTVDVVPVPVPSPTYTVTSTVPVGAVGDPAAMAVAPGPGQLLVANYNAGTVTIVSTPTDTVTATVPLYQPQPGPAYLPQPMGIVVVPSGTDAYVVDAKNDILDEIALTGPATGTVTAHIPVGNQGATDTPADIDVAQTPAGGTEVVIGDGGANTVSVVNAITNAVTTVTVAPAGQSPVALVAAPDGCMVGALTTTGAVTLISTATGTVTGTLAGAPATCLAAQPSSGSYEQVGGSVVAVPILVSYEVQAAQESAATGFKSSLSSPVTISLGRGQLP